MAEHVDGHPVPQPAADDGLVRGAEMKLGQEQVRHVEFPVPVPAEYQAHHDQERAAPRRRQPRSRRARRRAMRRRARAAARPGRPASARWLPGQPERDTVVTPIPCLYGAYWTAFGPWAQRRRPPPPPRPPPRRPPPAAATPRAAGCADPAAAPAALVGGLAGRPALLACCWRFRSAAVSLPWPKLARFQPCPVFCSQPSAPRR